MKLGMLRSGRNPSRTTIDFWTILQTNTWLIPPRPHCSGKVVVVGHTPQTEVLDSGYLICLDTGVWKGGWLTALDVESGKMWQVGEAGSLR